MDRKKLRYIRTMGILGAVFVLFLAFPGRDRVLLFGKHWLAEYWEQIEDKAMGVFMPWIYYNPDEKEKGISERVRYMMERSMDCWRYLQAGQDAACLEDDSTRKAVEQASYQSIAARLRESGAIKETEDAPKVELPLEQMRDFQYLLNHFFVLDPSTTITSEELNLDRLLEKDLTLKQDNQKPQILIYHSHSQEGFADSEEGNPETTVVAVGDYLEQLLTDKYGYQVLHLKESFDLIDGKMDRSAAYDYALERVEEVLQEHPSIEVVIDLHRDGVPDDVHLVTDIDGKPTAQIMFFNGLSKSKTKGPIEYLKNPYVEDNLAFSFRLEYEAAQYYPELARCVYLKCYRYNLHVRPKSLLLEVGAQTNTLQEAKNAMEPFAVILNKVLKGA